MNMMKIFLMLITLSTSFVKADISDCSRLWAKGYPGPKEITSRVECEKFNSRSRFTDKIKMFVLPSLDKSPFDQTEKQFIADALLYGHKYYSQFNGMPNVTLLLSGEAYEDAAGVSDIEAKTYANFYKNPESCPVVIYPSAKNMTKEHIQQLVAKELFHCYQADHFKNQVELVLSKGLGRWWYEGIALFMSNAVYPINDLEYSTKYPEINFEEQLPLQQNPKRLAHFFQAYFNHMNRKAETVINVMSAMPSTAYDSEVKIFARGPSFQPMFHAFAEDVILGKLVDMSGAAARLPRPNFQEKEVTFDQKQEFTFEVKTQKVFSYRLKFPKAGFYKFKIQDKPNISVSVRNLRDNQFSKFFDEMKSDCNQETVLEFLFTRINGDVTSENIKLEIERDDHEECECDVNEGIVDSCVFGKWEIVNPTVEAFLSNLLRMGPGQLLSVKSSGIYTVEFSRQSEAITTAAPWDIKIERKQTDGDIIKVDYKNVGQYVSKVGASKGILCAQEVSSAMSSQMTFTVRGRSQTMPSESAIKGLPFYMTYECEGDRLIYKDAIGVGPGGSNMTFNYEWKRIQ